MKWPTLARGPRGGFENPRRQRRRFLLRRPDRTLIFGAIQNLMRAKLFLVFLFVAAGAATSAEAGTNALPHIVTGNFGVSWIQRSPVGASPEADFKGEPVLPVEAWKGYAQSGLYAYEDYVAWGAVERAPGQWDWKRQSAVAQAQRAGGLAYDPYLWLMNPPAWMRQNQLPAGDPGAPDHYTLLRCLEHGEPTYTLSLFDPATVRWFERFYRELRKGLGDQIDRTYVGLVGPFGEGNYPLPVPTWLTIGHCHEGYWCGDRYAHEALIRFSQERYATLDRLNAAWGTRFTEWGALEFPPEIKAGKILKAEQRTDPKARRRWVDFIAWYHQAIVDFCAQVTQAALKYFPAAQLKLKPGGYNTGINPLDWGTYCPAYARAEAPFGIRLQPADCSGNPFGDRWCGTAYRFYRAPFSTEPAGELGTKDFRRRCFMDACNGATEMFTYQWEKHRPDALRWIHLYDGTPSLTDVAVYCPTTWYRLNGDLQPVIQGAASLRDLTDFEVADELLIQDDYLRKSKTRVLLWLQGPVVERRVLEKVLQWVKAGGILVAKSAQMPVDVEGRHDLGRRLFPDGLGENQQPGCRVGRGFVVCPQQGAESSYRDLVRLAVYHPERLDPKLKGSPEIGETARGVWTGVFPNRLLLFNTNEKPIDIDRQWNRREIKLRLESGELAEVNR
jgi:hypothetical protein